MNPVELHVAGATVQHRSPFSEIEVPTRKEFPPVEIREKWVRPLYFGLDKEHVDDFLEKHLSEADPELIGELLTYFEWRTRTTGALLAALDRHAWRPKSA